MTQSPFDDSLASTLASSLECPICVSAMSAPIYQCPNGHMICNVCQPQVDKCPTCKASKLDIRSRILEDVAEKLQNTRVNVQTPEPQYKRALYGGATTSNAAENNEILLMLEQNLSKLNRHRRASLLEIVASPGAASTKCMEVLREFNVQVPSGGVIIDIGAFLGHTCAAMAKQWPDAEVIAAPLTEIGDSVWVPQPQNVEKMESVGWLTMTRHAISLVHLDFSYGTRGGAGESSLEVRDGPMWHTVLDYAVRGLDARGCLVMKCFATTKHFPELLSRTAHYFSTVFVLKPNCARPSSLEAYVYATGLKSSPSRYMGITAESIECFDNLQRITVRNIVELLFESVLNDSS